MSLEQNIIADIKDAMLAKDAKRLEALRAVKAALMLEKTKGGAAAEGLSEDAEMRLLQKLVKQRKESAKIYRNQNRADLAETEEFQTSVIENYLPKQLDADEVRKILVSIVEQTGAQSMKDMGHVMGQANKQLAGKADNKTVAAIVKELLARK
ncbi:MAG TPA: GatB/YqeY domain-containing protein [Bacteroidales bacterium]|nr:GatB/YqeY domain-containing protein [Bacteroidales bacterium]